MLAGESKRMRSLVAGMPDLDGALAHSDGMSERSEKYDPKKRTSTSSAITESKSAGSKSFFFQDPVAAAEENDRTGRQTALNTARESNRYLNLRYEQLRARIEAASETLEEVKQIPVEMFELMDLVKDCQHRLDAAGFPPF